MNTEQVFATAATLGWYGRLEPLLHRRDLTNARLCLITITAVALDPATLTEPSDEDEILAGAAFLAAMVLGKAAADPSFPATLVDVAQAVRNDWYGLKHDLHHAAIALDVALYRYCGLGSATDASWLGRKAALRRVRTLIGQAIDVADPIPTIANGGSLI